jgi:hypothetical protein
MLPWIVPPAKAAVQWPYPNKKTLDSGFHRNDAVQVELN